MSHTTFNMHSCDPSVLHDITEVEGESAAEMTDWVSCANFGGWGGGGGGGTHLPPGLSSCRALGQTEAEPESQLDLTHNDCRNFVA